MCFTVNLNKRVTYNLYNVLKYQALLNLNTLTTILVILSSIHKKPQFMIPFPLTARHAKTLHLSKNKLLRLSFCYTFLRKDCARARVTNVKNSTSVDICFARANVNGHVGRLKILFFVA